MRSTPEDERQRAREQMLRQIERKERRRRRRRRHPDQIWLGVGAFGMVGWSIAIPTLIGIILALWLNSIYPGTWTIGIFLLGLAIGCWNAWLWVAREQRKAESERAEDDDVDNAGE